MAASGAELARTLRERRRALGLTRTRLADRLGLATVDIANWERGEALPNGDQIVLLADAVGLDDDETQAWLNAVVTVDVSGPEVAVEIVDGDVPPANPFSRRIRPLRGEPSRLDRIRSKVEGRRSEASSAPVQSFRSQPRPTPSRSAGLVSSPWPDRDFAAVPPESQSAAYDPAVRVYSARSGRVFTDEEQLYRLRRIRTTGVLLGLAIVGWWAFGALGEGVGDVFDLFRSPAETTLLP